MPSSNLFFSSFLNESRGLGTLGSLCIYDKRDRYLAFCDAFVKPEQWFLRIGVTEKDHYA